MHTYAVARALLVLALTCGARAQSYGYSYSYSYSYGSTGETACNATDDARGGGACEDRWAVLYPAELNDYAGHSCYYKNSWGQCDTWYVPRHASSTTLLASVLLSLIHI